MGGGGIAFYDKKCALSDCFLCEKRKNLLAAGGYAPSRPTRFCATSTKQR